MARKILLADDSVTAQNMGRKILADAGYEVVTVNNGSAALKKILEIKPDLVILDVYMPGYSGLEVCQRLKETPDSSRVPVLLTVGKLEPFKPEEAQRVRAEAFIVKPFEASELLSALSKLEDKVVPRSENPKSGRFARAIAAVEESSRGGIRPVDGGDANGWKNRISFPQEKTEPEEKVEDEASIYNQVNRDLRTVVASPSERVHERKEEEKRLQEMPVEPVVDLTAVAPAGTPQDVTPEEVAAIAAAAAQIQALQATLDEERNSGEEVSRQPIAAPTSALPETDAQAHQVGDSRSEHEAAEEAHDIPMTMAAAAGAESRWTAVSVALDAQEANISLEQEMQKAYAALVAEQSASAEEKSEAVQAESFAMTTESAGQQTVDVGSSSEAEPVSAPQPEPALTAAHQGEVASADQVATPASLVSSEAVAQETHLNAEPQPEHLAAQPEAVPTESLQPEPSSAPEPAAIVENALPPTEPIAVAQQEVPSQAEVTQAAAASYPFTSFVPSVQESLIQEAPTQEQRLEELHQAESAGQEAESVKSTAAAWASWRQIRDADEPAAESQEVQQESTPPQLLPNAAAMAVAAGAEQIAQEVPLANSENPADVASIVDSVLADLRPRLMAEISRKMSEKK